MDTSNLLVFSEAGTHLAVASDSGDIKIWKTDRLITPVSAIYHYTGVASSLGFTSDSKMLVAAYWYDSIRIWNLEKQQSQYPLETKALSKYSFLQVSTGSELFFIGVSENTIKVWKVGNSKVPVAKFSTDENVWWRAVALSPKTDLLVSGFRNGRLLVWDVRTGDKLQTLTTDTIGIRAVVFLADGKRLAMTSRNATQIWDIETGKQSRILPESPVLDGDMYKGKTHDIQERLKALSKGNKCLCSRSIQTLYSSPCGKFIGGGMPEEILLWNTTTYEICMVLLLPAGQRHQSALTFSRCGRYLAFDTTDVGTAEVSIMVWEVATGENIATFWGHPTDVQDLAFSPDGTLLASGSYDGTILLWDMKPYIQHETS